MNNNESNILLNKVNRILLYYDKVNNEYNYIYIYFKEVSCYPFATVVLNGIPQLRYTGLFPRSRYIISFLLYYFRKIIMVINYKITLC